MKKIYTIIFVSCLAAISFSSCSDWLDVRPADEIKEEYLFETGNGYRTALNGIYRKLATFDLYGSNLSWGLIDGWGQVYDLDKAPDSGGGKAMKKLSKFLYKNSELTPTTDAMWSAAWNIIANCNNLAQQVAEEDTMLFYKRTQEKNMILGEAIALRAYMHFDLLRIYAPSLAMNPGDRLFIPYVDKYPSYLSDRQTVGYCLERIIADLVEAQKILKDVDKSSEFTSGNRFTKSPSGEECFVWYRGFHLNYHAVTAELDRVYLYAGQSEKAYETAKLLIDINADKGYYKAVTSSYSVPMKIENGTIKMYEEIIFLDDQADQAMDTCASYWKYADRDVQMYPAFGNNKLRTEWVEKLKKEGISVPMIVHPFAYVSPKAKLSEGCVVLPYAIINTECHIAEACIVNCGAIIDHGCILEKGVHVAPGGIVKAENRIPAYMKVDSGEVIQNRSYQP